MNEQKYAGSPALAAHRAFCAENYDSDEEQPPANDEEMIVWLIAQLGEHKG